MTFFIFFLSFFYVFLKAFQQRNVTHDTKKTILPISIFMGVCEYTGVGIVSVTATSSGVFAAALLGVGAGFGGAAGCYCAIYLHKRLYNANS